MSSRLPLPLRLNSRRNACTAMVAKNMAMAARERVMFVGKESMKMSLACMVVDVRVAIAVDVDSYVPAAVIL